MTLKHTRLDRFNASIEMFDELRFKLKLDEEWRIVSCISLDYDMPYRNSWKEHGSGNTVIRIEPKEDTETSCPNCGTILRVKQHRDRRLKHLRGYGYDTVLFVHIPQLYCQRCGNTFMKHFPLARKDVGYTIEFEKWVLRTLMDKNVNKASKELSTRTWTIWNILRFRVEEALPSINLSGVEQISIDETSFGKRCDYVTVVSEKDRGLVFMCPGKGKEAVKEFCEWLILHGGDPSNIKVVCADMSSAYEQGVKEYIPLAILIFDKFHVHKLLNDDMDTVRKRLTRTMDKEDKTRLKHIKFTLMRHEMDMLEKDTEKLAFIRMANPELALAYDMKEAFFEIYRQEDKDAARCYFNEWWIWVSEEGCKEFKNRAVKLNDKLEKILNWYDFEVTNGFAEGLNSKIQKIKSDGCGFTNVDNFIKFCYFRLGNILIDFMDE